MPNFIAQHLSQLEQDEWRTKVGFAADIEEANQKLFRQGISEAESISVLNGWIQSYQPCLFGRIGAKLGVISYCILNEEVLRQRDEVIKEKVQASRLTWTRDAFEGKKSAFIILAVSPLIAYAKPSPAMKELARRLCQLYIETEVVVDQIYFDQIYLQKPGPRQTTWKWYTGVNYFCAQGDKRWWQDHRIPGGMAFSVNSVGHLVKSGIISNAMKELEALIGSPSEGLPDSKVDSLEKALELAMLTIGMASNAVSGKATELIPLPKDRSTLPVPECPVKLSKPVADKNHCEYKGWYHTDYTLPSEYFLPDVERPTGLKDHSLDFTYLFHKDIDNPDFRLAGEGQQIRGLKGVPEEKRSISYDKRIKGNEQEVPIDTEGRLVNTLFKK